VSKSERVRVREREGERVGEGREKVRTGERARKRASEGVCGRHIHGSLAFHTVSSNEHTFLGVQSVTDGCERMSG